MNDDVILAKNSGRVKIAAFAPSGRRVTPYQIEGQVLVKCVSDRHIFKAKQAVGIDEAVWGEHKDRIQVVRFHWWDGRIFEISAAEFGRKSFLHGDGISFAVTRFVRIADLRLVREAVPDNRQLSLQFGGGVA